MPVSTRAGNRTSAPAPPAAASEEIGSTSSYREKDDTSPPLSLLESTDNASSYADEHHVSPSSSFEEEQEPSTSLQVLDTNQTKHCTSDPNAGSPSSSPAKDPIQGAFTKPTPEVAPRHPHSKPKVWPEPELKRSAWGDKHAAREHFYDEQLIKAANKVQPGYYDAEYAAEVMKPWQEKGTLERKLPTSWLDPNTVRPQIMSLKEAEAIARKKDQTEQRFLRRWMAGEIDENGNPINGSTSADSSEDEDANEEKDDEEHFTDAESSNEKNQYKRISLAIAAPAEPKDSTTSSAGASSKAYSKETSFTMAASKSSSSKVPKPPSTTTTNPRKRKAPTSIDPPAQSTRPPPSRTPNPSSKKQKTHHGSVLPPPTSKPPTALSSKTKPKPKPTPQTSSTTRPKREPCTTLPTPLPGLPDYAPYSYAELAALCYQRNIMTTGNTASLRGLLIQDDINVVRGLPRDAKNYSERSRERKTVAPVVPGVPAAGPAVFGGAGGKGKGKRKRGEVEEGEVRGMGKGKRVKFED